jgi:hypothetical protein
MGKRFLFFALLRQFVQENWFRFRQMKHWQGVGKYKSGYFDSDLLRPLTLGPLQSIFELPRV